MSTSPDPNHPVAFSARQGAPRPFDVELEDFLEEVRQKTLDPEEAHAAVMLIAARVITIRLLIDMPATATDRQDLLAEIGTRLGGARDDIGPLSYIFLAVEAWMVRRHEALPGVSPKEHPGRIEILSIVTWQSSTNAYQARIYRILRADDGKVHDLVLEQDWEEARAYLVEAFVNAYA